MRDILCIEKCKRIAIMGGTFDPIHYGHLVTAEAVRKEFNAEVVIFIPTGHPPHKDENNVTHSEHRYLMTFLATVDNPYFEVSRIEIDRDGLTYTIDTIKKIKSLNNDVKIYFITGADAVSSILTWKDAEVLLTLCSFVAVTRPGYKKETLEKKVSDIKKKYKSKLHFFEVPALSISSSDIRNRVQNGLPIKYLLPEAVERYIYKSDLYTHSEISSFSAINEYVSQILSPKRYTHTLGVVKEAERLCDKYGGDVAKARIAAILHDIAKEIPSEEKRTLCSKYHVKLDSVMKAQIDLAHGPLAAKMAAEKFGIADKDILNAISYHTTGRKNMSLLEKIIYTADATDFSRDYYEGLNEIRDAVERDLDEAVVASLKITIAYNQNKKREVHPDSLEALEWLTKNR